MNEHTKKMVEALKERVVPYLRVGGFAGSFPHYRRIRSGSVDLISFTFSMYGGQFRVEIASCPPSGLVIGQQDVPAKKVKATDGGLPFIWLGPDPNVLQYWYEFDSQWGAGGKPNEVAQKVLECMPIAEAYWKNPKNPKKPNQSPQPTRPTGG